MAVVRHKEAIHSGHFMMSNFEADDPETDEEDIVVHSEQNTSGFERFKIKNDDASDMPNPDRVDLQLPAKFRTMIPAKFQPFIDTSFGHLFRRMTFIYRNKLTSPKWNKFYGVKFRQKDKIRLNNVIWRCWHMKFCKGQSKYAFYAFANPLEHQNQPQNCTTGGTLLEGKYWKRKLKVVTKEYMKWRIFYKGRGKSLLSPRSGFDSLMNSPFENHSKDSALATLSGEEEQLFEEFLNSIAGGHIPGNVLGSTSNSNALGAVPWSNTRDMYKNTTNADIIQPDLFHIDPNLDELFEMDSMSYSKPSESAQITEIPMDDSSNTSTDVQVQQVQPVQPIVQVDAYQSSMPSPLIRQSQPQNPFNGYPYNATTTSNCLVPINAPQSNANMLSPHDLSKNHARSPEPTRSPLYNTSPLSTCNAPLGKRNSPKHRILHHRGDFAQPSGKPMRHTPYKVPSPSSSSNQNNYPYSSRRELYQEQSQAKARAFPVQSVPHVLPALPLTHPDRKLLQPQKEPLILSRHHQRPENLPIYTDQGPNSQLISLLRDSNPEPRNLERLSCQISTYPTRPVVPPLPTNSIPQPSLEHSAYHQAQSVSPASSYSEQDERKKADHIVSEHSRRKNIKSGFDLLRSLIPSLAENPTNKISKAALLHKGASYLSELLEEKGKLGLATTAVKNDIARLNADIEKCQSKLAAASGCEDVGNNSTASQSHLEASFQEHVANCTIRNWRYWVFSLLMQPLYSSYTTTVKTRSMEDFRRSSMSWLDQHATLTVMRPASLGALKEVATKTNILADPSSIAQASVDAVLKTEKPLPYLQGELKQEQDRIDYS